MLIMIAKPITAEETAYKNKMQMRNGKISTRIDELYGKYVMGAGNNSLEKFYAKPGS